MKKRIFLITTAVFMCLFLIGYCIRRNSSSPDPIEPSVVVENVEKGTKTSVYSWTFQDSSGEVMIYHICLTEFSFPEAEEITGLHTEAISAVFDVENTPLLMEFDAHGHPAAIYRGEDYNYICCTTSTTASAVMKYNPLTFSDEDAIRSIRSIYKQPDFTEPD